MFVCVIMSSYNIRFWCHMTILWNPEATQLECNPLTFCGIIPYNGKVWRTLNLLFGDLALSSYWQNLNLVIVIGACAI